MKASDLCRGASSAATTFVETFYPLTLKGSDARDLRRDAWESADPNSNGIISLAEADAWIRNRLISEHNGATGDASGEVLWQTFRPAYAQAFHRAMVVAGDGAEESSLDSSYVTATEFRFFNAYLCIYVAMFDAFTAVEAFGKKDDDGADVVDADADRQGNDDADVDRRISKEEWIAAFPTMSERVGLVGLVTMTDPEAVFADMDKNEGGMILFKEWCDYLISREIEGGTEIGKLLAFRDDTTKKEVKESTAKPKEVAPDRTSVIMPSEQHTGERQAELGRGVSDDAVDLVNCFRAMVHRNESGLQLRKKEWLHIDGNGNGFVSLAEADRWIKDTLSAKCIKGEGERIWARYRKCYRHAFDRARNVSEEMNVGGAQTKVTSDDYIEKKEFRIFIGYLCVYAVMFDAFQLIDGGSEGIDEDDDLRIELDEWLAGFTRVTEHTLVGLKDASDPEAVFREMDVDGEGMVLLGEWCKYLTAKEVEAETVIGSLLEISTKTRAHTSTHKKSTPVKSKSNTPSRQTKTPNQGRATVLKPASRYTGERAIKLGRGVSDDAVDFVNCFHAMVHKNDRGLQLRKKEWHHIDGSGNGIASLAEADGWIKNTLYAKCIQNEGERIWARYRKCYRHAFNRAKNVSKEMNIGSPKATSDDYIDKKEFRIFIGFLCIYVIMFDAFQLVDDGGEGIDEDDDFRIELDGWMASYMKVSDHTLVGLKDVSDPAVVFQEMDADGKGMVLLGEWCKYLTAKEVEAQTALGSLLQISNNASALNRKEGTSTQSKMSSPVYPQ